MAEQSNELNVREYKQPRLVYIGDVPVESSYHGSALLFRLLQNYPPQCLTIIESTLSQSLPERRLPSVRYSQFPIFGKRLLYSRFHSWVSYGLSVSARYRQRALPKLLGDFVPQAVLTVAHGYLWITAAQFARHYNLPLHLIIHDDWPRIARLPGWTKAWLDNQFSQVYRYAVSRLCVSAAMVEEYKTRYGVIGEVLYPSRAADVVRPTDVVRCNTAPKYRLKIAFGGTINSPGYVQALNDLSIALDTCDGQLHLFCPLTQDELTRLGLSRDNVILHKLVPTNEFISTLMVTADVLFLPMSFMESERDNMRLCFPSKLADYTLCGMPILIYGPDYSSAVRWTNTHPGVAEVVNVQGVKALRAAVARLSDATHRRELGKFAVRVGDRYFSHEKAESQLFSALMNRIVTVSASEFVSPGG